MALNIKNPEVERLANEVSKLTGESKTEAIRRALEERREKLAFQIAPQDRKTRILRLLEQEIWPAFPEESLGRTITRQEEEDILGYGSEGV